MQHETPPPATPEEQAEKTGARIALAVSIIVVLGAIVPYWYALAHCPPDRINLGLSYNKQDEMLYLSWMRQAAEGGPVYDRMTTIPHPPLPQQNLWALLGWTVRASGASPNRVYHLYRILFAGLYLLILWAALRLWLPRLDARLVAFVAIAGGSGFGWLGLLWHGPAQGVGLDSLMAELWTYFSMFIPNYIGSLLLLTILWWCLWHLLFGRSSSFWPVATLYVVALLLLVEVHPYTYLPLFGATVGYVLLFGRADGLPRRRRALILLSLLPGAALLAYDNHQFALNPILREWSIQNDLPSPPLLAYVEGFGLAGVAAIFTILVLLSRWLTRRKSPPPGTEETSASFTPEAWAPASTLHFCAVWVVVAMILVYAYPWLKPARRCIEGMHIFLVVLAVPVFLEVLKPLLRRFTSGPSLSTRGLWILAAVVAIALWPTNVTVGRMAATTEALTAPAELGPIGRYIDTHLPPNAGIYTTHVGGGFVAAMTGRSVSLGHFHLTPEFDQRLAQVLYFQSPDATDQWRIDVLRASYCQYVLTESVKSPVTEDLTRLLGHPLFARGRFALYEIPQSILAGAPAH